MSVKISLLTIGSAPDNTKENQQRTIKEIFLNKKDLQKSTNEFMKAFDDAENNEVTDIIIMDYLGKIYNLSILKQENNKCKILLTTFFGGEQNKELIIDLFDNNLSLKYEISIFVNREVEFLKGREQEIFNKNLSFIEDDLSAKTEELEEKDIDEQKKLHEELKEKKEESKFKKEIAELIKSQKEKEKKVDNLQKQLVRFRQDINKYKDQAETIEIALKAAKKDVQKIESVLKNRRLAKTEDKEREQEIKERDKEIKELQKYIKDVEARQEKELRQLESELRTERDSAVSHIVKDENSGQDVPVVYNNYIRHLRVSQQAANDRLETAISERRKDDIKKESSQITQLQIEIDKAHKKRKEEEEEKILEKKDEHRTEKYDPFNITIEEAKERIIEIKAEKKEFLEKQVDKDKIIEETEAEYKQSNEEAQKNEHLLLSSYLFDAEKFFEDKNKQKITSSDDTENINRKSVDFLTTYDTLPTLSPIERNKDKFQEVKKILELTLKQNNKIIFHSKTKAKEAQLEFTSIFSNDTDVQEKLFITLEEKIHTSASKTKTEISIVIEKDHFVIKNKDGSKINFSDRVKIYQIINNIIKSVDIGLSFVHLGDIEGQQIFGIIDVDQKSPAYFDIRPGDVIYGKNGASKEDVGKDIREGKLSSHQIVAFNKKLDSYDEIKDIRNDYMIMEEMPVEMQKKQFVRSFELGFDINKSTKITGKEDIKLVILSGSIKPNSPLRQLGIAEGDILSFKDQNHLDKFLTYDKTEDVIVLKDNKFHIISQGPEPIDYYENVGFNIPKLKQEEFATKLEEIKDPDLFKVKQSFYSKKIGIDLGEPKLYGDEYLAFPVLDVHKDSPAKADIKPGNLILFPINLLPAEISDKEEVKLAIKKAIENGHLQGSFIVSQERHKEFIIYDNILIEKDIFLPHEKIELALQTQSTGKKASRIQPAEIIGISFSGINISNTTKDGQRSSYIHIESVAPKSIAELRGLKKNDVIYTLGQFNKLDDFFKSKEITVLRDGKFFELEEESWGLEDSITFVYNEKGTFYSNTSPHITFDIKEYNFTDTNIGNVTINRNYYNEKERESLEDIEVELKKKFPTKEEKKEEKEKIKKEEKEEKNNKGKTKVRNEGDEENKKLGLFERLFKNWTQKKIQKERPIITLVAIDSKKQQEQEQNLIPNPESSTSATATSEKGKDQGTDFCRDLEKDFDNIVKENKISPSSVTSATSSSQQQKVSRENSSDSSSSSSSSSVNSSRS